MLLFFKVYCDEKKRIFHCSSVPGRCSVLLIGQGANERGNTLGSLAEVWTLRLLLVITFVCSELLPVVTYGPACVIGSLGKC